MATIYRIVVEQSSKTTSADGRKSSDKLRQAAKSSTLGIGPRGGVEHNRKMRAINPLLNKATSGYWEKGMRLGRASLGLAKNIEQKGMKGILAGPSIAIIIALVLQTLIKWQNKERQKAQQLNAQNYKSLENGVGAINSAYSVEVNFWTGRQTYNQNK